jgi:hypothetical protein
MATMVANYVQKRRWPRYQISVPIIVVVRRAGKTVLANGRGTELNEGGMAIFASTELRPGDEVEVSFTPPYGSTPIEVRCMIRNRSGYTYGAEFLSGTPAEAESVAQIRQVLQAMGSPV